MRKLLTIALIFITSLGCAQPKSIKYYFQWLKAQDITNTRHFIWHGDTIDFNQMQLTDSILIAMTVDTLYIGDDTIYEGNFLLKRDSLSTWVTPKQLHDSLFSTIGHPPVTSGISAQTGGLNIDSTQVLVFQSANGSRNGYLLAVDWTNFNNKLSSVTHDESLDGLGTPASPLVVDTVSWVATKYDISFGNIDSVLMASKNWVKTYVYNWGVDTLGTDWTGTFDGQEGTYYLNYNNLSNKPTIPIIENDAYGVTWDNDLDGATKNAIYDAIQGVFGGVAHNALSLDPIKQNGLELNTGTQVLGLDTANVSTTGALSKHDYTKFYTRVLSKSKTGNSVTVNINDGTGTTFSVADADSSATNEIQNLSYTAATRALGITLGTGVTLPAFSTSGTNHGLTPGSNNVGPTYYLNGNGAWTVPNGTVYTEGQGIDITAGVVKMDINSITTTSTPADGTTQFLPWGYSVNGNHNKVSISALSDADFWNAEKLRDFTISTTDPTNGQLLSFNSTTSQWEPKTISTGGSLWTADSYGINYQGGNVSIGLGSLTDARFRSYVNASGKYAGLFQNQSSTGYGVYIQAGSNSDSYPSLEIENYSGTDVFKVNGNGKVFANALTNSTKSNVLYYDSSTKEITYGAAPSGGSSLFTDGGTRTYGGYTYLTNTAQNLMVGTTTPPSTTFAYNNAKLYVVQDVSSSPLYTAIFQGTGGNSGVKIIAGSASTSYTPLDVRNVNNTGLFNVSGNGKTTLGLYGLGTFTGTPAYYLAVTSSGQVMEMPAPAGSGSVTSVGLSMPSIFTVTGSPVTTSGTLTASLASQTANYVFAAPNGSAGTPTFRLLVDNDIPNTITVSNYLPLAGGTMTGKIKAATPGTSAGLNLPHGAIPSSLVDGDMWTTTSGVYARINGSTVQLSTSSGAYPGGTGTELQYRLNGTTFGAVTGSSVSTNSITLTGTATASNFILSSDRRLKSDIQDIRNLKWVDYLDFKQFYMKDDLSERIRYGLIAQSVKELQPNMVYENEKGELSLGYTDILIAVVARQKQQILDLQERVERLEMLINEKYAK